MLKKLVFAAALAASTFALGGCMSSLIQSPRMAMAEFGPSPGPMEIGQGPQIIPGIYPEQHRDHREIDTETLIRDALKEMGKPPQAASYHFNIGKQPPAAAVRAGCEVVQTTNVDGYSITRRRCPHVG
jgi:hypothetical protein